MKPDIILQLGDVAFERFEVPESLPFGGEQMLATTKLVGGTRQVQAMGRDDKPIEWSGMFLGSNASLRAQLLDAMRIEGRAHPLSWGRHSYTVVIASFEPDFRRKYQIPYRISCMVVEDLATPSGSEAQASLDDQIEADLENAETKGGLIGNATLTGMITTIRSAVGKVTSFVSATSKELQSSFPSCRRLVTWRSRWRAWCPMRRSAPPRSACNRTSTSSANWTTCTGSTPRSAGSPPTSPPTA